MTGDEERVDRLLSAPLPPVEDDGFSTRVTMKMAVARARQSWLETLVLVASGTVFLAALSAAGFPEWAEHMSLSLATSLPLAIAGFALALTLFYARAVTE